jgi:transcriptional regulator with XRE-family HTH domain
MNDILESLRHELRDPEYSEVYAESFLDSLIATQIKVLREQSGLSQQDLAEKIGTRQSVLSRIENINYSKWNVTTLKKLARAFRVRLKVSFETYGSLIMDVQAFSREGLQRTPRELDPVLLGESTPWVHRATPWHGDKRGGRKRKKCVRLDYPKPWVLEKMPDEDTILFSTNNNASQESVGVDTALSAKQSPLLRKTA